MNLQEKLCLPVANDLSILASLHDSELDTGKLEYLKQIDFPDNLCLRLTSENATLAVSLLRSSIIESTSLENRDALDELSADFAAIYLTHSLRASPLESVWIDEENLMMQDAMFQIRSWYKRFGFEVPNWRIRSEDHLVYQLDFIMRLFSESQNPGDLKPIAQFMDEHILQWLEHFSSRVVSRCETEFYAGLTMLTFVYLDELRNILAEITNQQRPEKIDIAQQLQNRPVSVEEEPLKYIPGLNPSW